MASNRNRSGQTLIETIVALTMLTTAFLGIAALLTQSFFITRTTTNQDIAVYLAAEGIEVTKNIIDHDVYDPSLGWGALCNFNCNGVQALVSYDSTSLINARNRPLVFNSVNNTYGYTNGTSTIFSRQIILSSPSPSEIDVESVVTWNAGTPFSSQLILEDHFYDWHP